mmetsp:Transcript_44696/g.105211  ORF Transcript_44696/g.105211 Transcript_44696/m.105211 type:complete len:204 (-) Transcript_44696:594-1205(-)
MAPREAGLPPVRRPQAGHHPRRIQPGPGLGLRSFAARRRPLRRAERPGHQAAGAAGGHALRALPGQRRRVEPQARPQIPVEPRAAAARLGGPGLPRTEHVGPLPPGNHRQRGHPRRPPLPEGRPDQHRHRLLQRLDDAELQQPRAQARKIAPVLAGRGVRAPTGRQRQPGLLGHPEEQPDQHAGRGCHPVQPRQIRQPGAPPL